MLSLISVITSRLQALDSYLCTNTQLLVLSSLPDIDLIYIHHPSATLVSFISDVFATRGAVFLLVALNFVHHSIHVDSISSKLATMCLSLSSIQLTPNPSA